MKKSLLQLIFTINFLKKINICVLIGICTCLNYGCGFTVHFNNINSTKYKSLPEHSTINFNCDTKNQNTCGDIVKITTNDIKNCFFSDTLKITWLYFYSAECMSCIGNIPLNVQLYRQFSENFNLVIVSMTYDYLEIKRQEMISDFPIYFIDPSFHTSWRKNRAAFINNLIQEADNTKKTGNHLFMYQGKILKDAFEVD